MLHSFYAAVQCVLPQSDVQERCIVYRVVHGAQYAGVCPLVQEWCTVCMRVHCLAGAAEEECGMHWLAGAERASLECAGGCRWGAVHAGPHCSVKECGGAQCWVQEFGGVEWTQEFAGGVQCHTQEQSGPHCTLQG